jgi:integrase
MAWIEKRQRQHHVAHKVYWRDPSGKVRTRTFTRATDAQRFARDVEHRKDRGDYIDPAAGNITLAEMVDQYVSTADLRSTTAAKYETLGRLYLTDGIGQQPIRTITKADVRSLYAQLRKREKGTATIEAVARLLHRVFEVAVDEDRIGRNPAHGVRVAPADRRPARFLSETEVAAIADGVPPRFRALVWTLALGGLRIGEASALRVRHLDLKAGTILVEESSPEVAGRKITGPTKSGKARTADIPLELRKMLGDHLDAYGNRFAPDSYVFTGPEGGQVRQNAFRKRIFQPAAERAGIEPVPTAHDLRHTAASFMARSGFTLLEAASQLGNGATTMTARYSHVFPSERQAKAARLGTLIGSA